MPPCHGGGRGFESRPVRKKFNGANRWTFFIFVHAILPKKTGPAGAEPGEALQVCSDPTTGRVQVRNMTGRLVLETAVQGAKINLRTLPDGVYVLTVQEAQTGRRWVGKVLVLK